MPQQFSMQRSPLAQSAFEVQGAWLAQASNGPHQHPLLSVRTQQLQAPPLSLQSMAKLQGMLTSQGHCGGSFCAKAGVLRLVRTGADHAMAAPAPIRLSALRREIPSSETSM
jgi:hypothetical protein